MTLMNDAATNVKDLLDADLTDASFFDHWTPVTLRFSDQDSMGHVNNVSYGAFVEAGRTMYVSQFLQPEHHPGIDFVLARVAIDYIREMHYPGTLDVGTRLLRVGNTSIVLGTGMFLNGVAIAKAHSVNVFIDVETRKPTPAPDEIRRFFSDQLARI